ncbi:hypothetical protein W909_09090 [Dickeya zeae EC1]|nr:hypothetical protein W909_09090 [Dickeya zeae EC1]
MPTGSPILIVAIWQAKQSTGGGVKGHRNAY